MVTKKDKEVAKQGPTGVGQAYDYGADAGVGFENTSSADYAIPFLAIMQSNSPEIDGSVPGRELEGAKIGMLMDTVSRELFDGDKGVIFVPCDTQHVFVEWKPRKEGGGFVGVRQLNDEIVSKAVAAAEKFGKNKTDEGNELNETFYLYGLILEDENATEPMGMAVVAFTSTKIKKYKQVMYRLRTFKGRPPLFANRLRISTVPDSNEHGNFRNFKVEPAIGNSIAESLMPPTIGEGDKVEPNPVLIAGKQLMEQIRSGLARAAHESTSNAGGDGDGDTGSAF